MIEKRDLMILALSNLAFVGFNYASLKHLPDNLGIELFYEFGNDYYWERVINEIYGGRPRNGLSIHGPCIGVNLADEDDTHYLSVYKNVFEFAAKQKVGYIVVHTNEAFTGDVVQVRDRVKEKLASLLRLAAKYGVRLLIENVGLKGKGTLLFDWRDYLELLRSLPDAGALLDVGHAYLNKWPMLSIVKVMGATFAAYHLHDNHGEEDEHLPIGQGNIDWDELFGAIRAYSPAATLVFEYANVNLRAALENIGTVTGKYLDASIKMAKSDS